MGNTKSQLEIDATIDPHDLENELMKQPGLMAYYSEQLAVASRKVDYLEEDKKILRSDLILEATKGGESLIGCKPTAPTIEAWYRSQDDYVAVVDDLIEATYKKNLMDAAVRAMIDRKKCLEKLCELYQHEYYSEVDVTRREGRKKVRRKLNKEV